MTITSTSCALDNGDVLIFETVPKTWLILLIFACNIMILLFNIKDKIDKNIPFYSSLISLICIILIVKIMFFSSHAFGDKLIKHKYLLAILYSKKSANFLLSNIMLILCTYSLATFYMIYNVTDIASIFHSIISIGILIGIYKSYKTKYPIIMIFDNNTIYINSSMIKDQKVSTDLLNNMLFSYDLQTKKLDISIKWYPYILFQKQITNKSIRNNKNAQIQEISNTFSLQLKIINNTKLPSTEEVQKELLNIVDQLNNLYKEIINVYQQKSYQQKSSNKWLAYKYWINWKTPYHMNIYSTLIRNTLFGYEYYEDLKSRLESSYSRFPLLNIWNIINNNSDIQNKLEILSSKYNGLIPWHLKHKTFQNYINFIKLRIQNNQITGEEWYAFQSLLGICIENYSFYSTDSISVADFKNLIYETNQIMFKSQIIDIDSSNIEVKFF